MKKKEFELFQKVNIQMENFHSEVSILSKKSPDTPINVFKLKYINQVLESANQLLGKDKRPFADFEKFDEVELPVNSDVVMILSQYLGCLEKYRVANIYEEYGSWYWIIDGKQTDTSTLRPKGV